MLLPNDWSAPFAQDVYSVGRLAADERTIPPTLTLAHPPHPAVAHQLSHVSDNLRKILITFDNRQLRARVRRGAAEIDTQAVSCLDANHPYGSTGDEMLRLGSGSPQPPRTLDE